MSCYVMVCDVMMLCYDLQFSNMLYRALSWYELQCYGMACTVVLCYVMRRDVIVCYDMICYVL